ncbi:DUF397 domain-containing protein [Embleya sp. NPDC050493]|uniref:DUF397 domain-containing protein n=1 Tax=Embleya sp. NPDC050493 TaxID=3363989 RepID=UPI0037BC8554
MAGDTELHWRKAKASEGTNNCVDSATRDGQAYVRDAKDRARGMLAFGSASWEAMAAALQG